MATGVRPPSPALRDYQARTLRALQNGMEQSRGELFTVMFPRQAGKNEVAAALVAWLLQTHARRGGTVIICAPTYRPQARISFERVRRALQATRPLLPGAVTAETGGNAFRLGRAEAVFLSASPFASVAGHTASLALIADEAQDIDEEWFTRQFRPMAASTGAPTVLFGTPWNGRTLLERAVARNRAHDSANANAIPRHHQVSWQEVAATRPRYGEYVEHERARLGADHPLYLSQYELVAAEGNGRLLSAAQVEALRGDHVGLAGPVRGERYVAGLDFGGEGRDADRTVLTIARVVSATRLEVVHLRAWQGAPFAVLREEVVDIARGWALEKICADATGLGGPLVSSLANELEPRIEPVVFTAATKSALGYALIAAANSGSLALHADDGSRVYAGCVGELLDCAAGLRGHGGLWWGSTYGHDDFVVSLALCLRAGSGIGAPRVAVGRRRTDC